MRRIPTTPAAQLGSVSLRYRSRHHRASSLAAPSPSGRWISGPAFSGLFTTSAPKSAATALADDDEDPELKLQRLEAVLFLAREPLNSRKLSQHANLADGTQARTLVRRLNQRLDQWGRAFRIQDVAGGFQLTTRQKFAKWLRRLEHVPSAERLSAPSLETLAVVAYRQPVMRADIEAIRGVACGEILNQLMSRDLVRVGGRSNELGRPYLYNTTRRFLQLFGLKSLEELPQVEAFQSATGYHRDDEDTKQSHDDSNSLNESDLEAEEDSQVSISLEQEQLKIQDTTGTETLALAPVDSPSPDRLRSEDDVDDDEDEYEYVDGDEDEEEDDEYEYEYEDGDSDADDDEDEDEDEYEYVEEEVDDDDDSEDDEDDYEYVDADDEDDDDEEEELDDDEDSEWVEVDDDDEADDDLEEEDWEEEDWEDGEEWE